MRETLQKRVEGAIWWSFCTWHWTTYGEVGNVVVIPIAGKLYHVSFTLGKGTDQAKVDALYLDIEVQGQNRSLFLDSDTLTWAIEQRIEAYVESSK